MGDLIEPEYEKLKKEIGSYYQKDEDILTYGMFPQVAQKYFQWRDARDRGLDYNLMDGKNKIHPV